MNRHIPKMESPHNQKNAQPNNTELTLTREQMLNLENLKIIMGSEKTTIHKNTGNIKWRTVKTETNKINQVLPYISTN